MLTNLNKTELKNIYLSLSLSSSPPPPPHHYLLPFFKISLQEMSERETRDFMSVESFSQLPFIRPAPARDKTSAIRLFGIEVPHEPDSHKEHSKDNTANAGEVAGSGESGRKFECHYCCRNFPTSQALGGHQNAHKRERQNAKRAHLQSAMAAHHHQEGHHIYGLVNYHGLGSARFAFQPSTPSNYPSWNIPGPRFYGGLGSVSQPINGNPLPGVWRVQSKAVHGGASVPLIHRDRAMPLPLFGGDTSRAMGVGVGIDLASSSSSPSMQSVKDNVSLDLHL